MARVIEKWDFEQTYVEHQEQINWALNCPKLTKSELRELDSLYKKQLELLDYRDEHGEWAHTYDSEEEEDYAEAID